MAEDRNQKVVCILGMHRSGTSALTRIVNLLGVELGPSNTLSAQPAPDNAKGHWEHSEITSINDAILRRFGGSWDDPPTFPAGWQTSAAVADLRDRARQLIKSQFSSYALWGWKDPRTCLTLPFWQQLLSSVNYIICLRNPVDVASSLEQRDGFSAEKSFDLWITYVLSALKYTEGRPHLVVFYEDLIDASRDELDRLAEFLGQREHIKRSDLQGNVDDFIDRGLRHHHSSVLDSTFQSAAEQWAKSLYLSQHISVSLSRKQIDGRPVLDQQIFAALEDLNVDSFRTDEDQSELKTLARQLIEKDLLVQRLSDQLQQQTRFLASQAESAEKSIGEVSEQLRQKQLEVERIKETLGFRILNRCWQLKHRYFLLLFRDSGSS